MKVTDLITHLTAYAAQSPENGSAEVLLQSFDEMCYGIAGANDGRGMSPGEHALIIVPDLKVKVSVKALKLT